MPRTASKLLPTACALACLWLSGEARASCDIVAIERRNVAQATASLMAQADVVALVRPEPPPSTAPYRQRLRLVHSLKGPGGDLLMVSFREEAGPLGGENLGTVGDVASLQLVFLNASPKGYFVSECVARQLQTTGADAVLDQLLTDGAGPSRRRRPSGPRGSLRFDQTSRDSARELN